jgi:hypothetical protein
LAAIVFPELLQRWYGGLIIREDKERGSNLILQRFVERPFRWRDSGVFHVTTIASQALSALYGVLLTGISLESVLRNNVTIRSEDF